MSSAVIADNPSIESGESLFDSFTRFLENREGLSWNSETGDFLERGKFKAKAISGGKFIESMVRATEECLKVFKGGTGSGSPVNVLADSPVLSMEEFQVSVYCRLYDTLVSEYGEPLVSKLATTSGTQELHKILLSEYVREFPLPIELGTGSGTIRTGFDKYRPGSCMGSRIGSGSEDWVEVYGINPDKVGIVWTDGKHPLLTSAASALVWFGKSETYVDKLYCSGWSMGGMSSIFSNSVREFLLSELGLPVFTVYKHTQTWDIPPRTGGTVLKFRMKFHGELMPYCDNLAFASVPESGSFLLSTSNSGDCEIECRDVEGTDITTCEKCKCLNCRTGISEDECCYTENSDGPYCSDCYGELFSYSEYDGCDYASDEVSYVTILDSIGREREISISQDTLRNDFYEYSGELHSDVEWIHSSQAVELSNGEYVSSDETYSYDTEPDDLSGSEWIVPYDDEIGYQADDLSYDIPSGRWLKDAVPPLFALEPSSGEYERKLTDSIGIRWNPDSTHRYKVILLHRGGTRTVLNSNRFGLWDSLRFASLVYLGLSEDMRNFVASWEGVHDPLSEELGPIIGRIAREINRDFMSTGN